MASSKGAALNLLPLLYHLLLLGLICQSADSLPQQQQQRRKELVLEQPPPADSATSETAVVRQLSSSRRTNAIPQSQVVKIANLTRQNDGDDFQAHGECHQNEDGLHNE